MFARGKRLVWAVAAVLCAVLALPAGRPYAASPDMLLGMFWNSDSDLSDTLYVSYDGVHFDQISTPYPTDGANGGQHVAGAPSYVNALHDPGLFYKDGTYWSVSGFVQKQEGLGWRFTPMFGSSRDLVHWSYPNSGSPTNLAPSQPVRGAYGDGQFDTAGTDAMADANGDVWVVTTLGYFGLNHGDAYHDTMMPYVVKVTGLQPGADPAVDPGAQPLLSYGSLTPINLPDTSTTNWLDPSLFQENGTYYLSIKKNGVTNQIWSISDLNRAGDASAWKLVCGDAVTGYEGPSLAKLNGTYRLYVDKLKDYPAPGNGKTGIFVTSSSALSGGWSAPRRIVARSSQDGSIMPTRHGSVLAIKDPAQKELINQLHRAAGWADYDPSAPAPKYITDVDSYTPHSGDIMWLVENGISTGWDDGNGTAHFSGMSAVVRQDMAAFLHRLAGFAGANLPERLDLSFTDVTNATPHADDIRWLARTGISTGWDDGGGKHHFSGMSAVTRQDMAAFLYRLAGSPDFEPTAEQKAKFTDVNDATPHAKEIWWLAATGVSTGWDDGNGKAHFSGMSTVVRQDMAAFLHRLYEKGLIK